MTRKSFLLLATILLFSWACKKDTVQTPTDKITAFQWKIDRFTLADKTTVIDPTLFNDDAKYINSFTYVFTSDGQVKSTDKDTKQAGAYGTWAFNTDATSGNVKIQGLGGSFPVIELTSTSMILQNTAKYNGQNIAFNMVFVPVL
jgi:hypothetical protein